jgi:hypothetical protein
MVRIVGNAIAVCIDWVKHHHVAFQRVHHAVDVLRTKAVEHQRHIQCHDICLDRTCACVLCLSTGARKYCQHKNEKAHGMKPCALREFPTYLRTTDHRTLPRVFFICVAPERYFVQRTIETRAAESRFSYKNKSTSPDTKRYWQPERIWPQYLVSQNLYLGSGHLVERSGGANRPW